MKTKTSESNIEIHGITEDNILSTSCSDAVYITKNENFSISGDSSTSTTPLETTFVSMMRTDEGIKHEEFKRENTRMIWVKIDSDDFEE